MKNTYRFSIIMNIAKNLHHYLPFSPPGAKIRLSGVSTLLLSGLLLVMLVLPAGCRDLPFAKKTPPPQTQMDLAYEPPTPPTPLAPGPADKPAPAPVYTTGSSNVSDTRLADLASQFEALRARLQIVEGKLAEQEHQLNQLARSGNPEQTQMRDRLIALERNLAAAQERLARLEGGRPSQAARPELPPTADTIREIAPPPPPPKTGGDPFQEGMTLHKQKSYGPAKDKFQQYLKDHPKGDKAVEARYYLADSLLQDKKYDEAIVEYNKVVEGHPQSPCAPPALLKQAQAFKAQGKSKVSNLVLEKLIADHPKSPEAVQARKLLGNR
jgi:tol-pal system protein YbgF